MLMKWFAYACCAVGFLALVFGTTDEESVGGGLFVGGGVLIYTIVRVLDRIDSDGAGEL